MDDTVIAKHLENLDHRLENVEQILLQSIEPRLERVEQILPTLATREDLRKEGERSRQHTDEVEERSRQHTDDVEERLRRHMDVLTESLRGDIHMIAAHVASERPKDSGA